MPSSILRRTLCSLAFIGAVSAPMAARAFDASSVNGFCLAGFNAAMTAAGKTAPPGMAEYTCNCFSDQLQQGQSIEKARVFCRAAAAQKYTVK